MGHFLGLGAYLGLKEVHAWRISKDRHKGEITIPGNYSTLVLIVLIFVLQFFWGYFYATRTEIFYWIYFADTLTSSVVTGLFWASRIFFQKLPQKVLSPFSRFTSAGMIIVFLTTDF